MTITEFLFTGMLHLVFGVMYLEFLDYYNSDPASVAWVGSVAAVINSALGKTFRTINNVRLLKVVFIV